MRRLLPLAVASVAAAYFGLFVTYGFELEDEGLMLLQGLRTLHGQLPYVDFETGYAPAVFYLHAALFRLFGESVVPVRVALLLVHSAIVGLMCMLAQPRAGPVLAATVALAYAAFLRVFPGQFATFNIPYPAWYAGLAGLAAQAAMDHHLRRGGRAALVVAGLCAGLALAFKQNVGVLALLACGLCLALRAAGHGDRDRYIARILLLAAAAAALALPAVDLTVSLDVLLLSYGMLVAPLLMLVTGRLAWARAPTSGSPRLVVAIALVASGSLCVTLPWLGFFLPRLGVERFLRDVLLLGSGAEGIYGEVFPLSTSLPAAWALVAAAAVVVLAAAGIAVERDRRRLGWVAVLLAGAGLAAGGSLIGLARMPEGLSPAVAAQVLAMCFVLMPVLGCVAALRLLRHWRERDDDLRPAFIGTVVFAACIFLAMYPRMDEGHLLMVLPAPLVVAAGAVRRVARAWSAVLAIPEWLVVGGSAALIAGLALVIAAPGVVSTLAPEQTALDSTRLPVRMEARRASDLRALGHVLHYLDARLTPGDRVFGFPALGLVTYALGGRGADRWGYFFPGRPDHAAEAQMLKDFERRPPRFLVTLNRGFGYFFEAPIYYFLLRDWVQEHYALVLRAGRYDVLEPRARGVPRPPSALVEVSSAQSDDSVEIGARMADPEREVRRAAVQRFLAEADDADGVARVASMIAVEEASRLMLMRNLGEFGDQRGLPFLVREYLEGTTPRLRDEAAGALMLLYFRDTQAPYLFAGDGASIPASVWRQLPLAALRERIATPDGMFEIGVFAAHALASAEDAAAVPVLEQALGREELSRWFFGTWLRVAATEALVRLGHPERLCDLVELFGLRTHEVQDIMPSRFIREARRHPGAAAQCLARGLVADEPAARELSAYVVAAVPLPVLANALRAPRDEDPAVRFARAWALARLEDRSVTGALSSSSPARDRGARGQVRHAHVIDARVRLGRVVPAYAGTGWSQR